MRFFFSFSSSALAFLPNAESQLPDFKAVGETIGGPAFAGVKPVELPDFKAVGGAVGGAALAGVKPVGLPDIRAVGGTVDGPAFAGVKPVGADIVGWKSVEVDLVG